MKVTLLSPNSNFVAEFVAACLHRGWDFAVAEDQSMLLRSVRRDPPDAIALSALLGREPVATMIQTLHRSIESATLPMLVIDADATDAAEFQEADAVLPAPTDATVLTDQVAALSGREPGLALAPASVIADARRLRSLLDSGLLDIRQDPFIDQLTILCSRQFRVPVALLSAVDEKRQYFSSQVGLGEPWAEERETPLSHSFCQWVVADNRDLVVSDAREHPGLKDNLAIRDLGVIAYAGVPVKLEQDQPLASFCVIDTKPHRWSQGEVMQLRAVARIIEGHLASRIADAGITGNPALRLRQHAEAACAVAEVFGYGAELTQAERQMLLDFARDQQQRMQLSLQAIAG